MAEPIYSADGVTIYNGECIDVLRGLPPASVNVVLTDPPYSSGGMVRGDRVGPGCREKYQKSVSRAAYAEFSGDNRDQRGFLVWCVLWLEALRRVVKPGGIVACFSDWRQVPTMTDALQAGGLVWRGIVPWVKTCPRPCKGRWAAAAEYVVWGTVGKRPLAGPCLPGAYTCGSAQDRLHMTEKPLALMGELCRIAFEPGATILDPFCGSGTTLLAAKQRGVASIGIEIDDGIAREAVARCKGACQAMLL